MWTIVHPVKKLEHPDAVNLLFITPRNTVDKRFILYWINRSAHSFSGMLDCLFDGLYLYIRTTHIELEDPDAVDLIFHTGSRIPLRMFDSLLDSEKMDKRLSLSGEGSSVPRFLDILDEQSNIGQDLLDGHARTVGNVHHHRTENIDPRVPHTRLIFAARRHRLHSASRIAGTEHNRRYLFAVGQILDITQCFFDRLALSIVTHRSNPS